ncbi:MAG: helix-turn-helix transcriptional regulator [Bacteroides sp.]|nr:helix-turn-helix transcriptional regulator [Bacteroides sp.]
METDINRLKVVLAEKKRTNKWLCEQLKVNPSTVSKWCTNSSQPDLETLVKIANLLEVELAELVNKQCMSGASNC